MEIGQAEHDNRLQSVLGTEVVGEWGKPIGAEPRGNLVCSICLDSATTQPWRRPRSIDCLSDVRNFGAENKIVEQYSMVTENG